MFLLTVFDSSLFLISLTSSSFLCSPFDLAKKLGRVVDFVWFKKDKLDDDVSMVGVFVFGPFAKGDSIFDSISFLSNEILDDNSVDVLLVDVLKIVLFVWSKVGIVGLKAVKPLKPLKILGLSSGILVSGGLAPNDKNG